MVKVSQLTKSDTVQGVEMAQGTRQPAMRETTV